MTDNPLSKVGITTAEALEGAAEGARALAKTGSTLTPRETQCVHPIRTLIRRLTTTDRRVEDCQLCDARLTTDTRTRRTTEEVTGR